MKRAKRAIAGMLCGLCAMASAQAHGPAAQGIGVDPRLGATIPGDIRLRDESGRAVELRDYFGARAVVLAPVYYDCPNLCSLTLGALVHRLDETALTAGSEFELVAVSIDPHDSAATARRKAAALAAALGKADTPAGWHFLTGDQSQVERFTRAIGVRYHYDAEHAQYAHPAAVLVATPQARIARYFPGIDWPARDLRLALVEANDNAIGSISDRLWLLCLHYDPKQGRYGAAIENAYRIGGAASLAALGGLILVLRRREHRGKRPRKRGADQGGGR